MNRAVLTLAGLLLLAGGAVQAQGWGPAVLGIQGGFTYFKYDGSRYYDTELNLPGVFLGPGLPSPSAIWLRAPVHGPLAVEGSISAGVTSGPGFETSWSAASVRADYLLPRGLYASAGFLADRAGSVSGATISSVLVWGVQAGVGVRVPLGPVIEGRVEAVAQFWEKKGTVPAQNAYSLMIGAGAPLTGRAGASARSATGATVEPGSWQLAFGTSASVAVSHAVGPGATVVAVMLPGWGGGSGILFTPAPFYLTVPIGARFALEPSLDLHRSHFLTTNSGLFTASTTTLGLRMNYGFRGGWYSGAGLVVIGRKGTGRPWRGISGVSVEGGYRFHLSGAWGGRIEVSHTMLARQRAALEPPQNVTALSAGATVDLR